MRVLHLAPLWFPVSRDSAGGRETLLATLVAAQQELGCHVAVLASGDSQVAGEIIPVLPRNLFAAMQAQEAAEAAYYEQEQLLLTLAHATEFDIVHSHAGWYAYALSGVPGLGSRLVHTQHTPVWRDLEWFIRQHPDFWYTAVSEFLASSFWQQGATRCTVIPNGIDLRAFPWTPNSGQGLVFIGRIEWSKGPDLALAAARDTGRPLILAGPIIDPGYYDKAIAPFLDDHRRYIGQVDHVQRNQLLGEAFCAVLPFREPQGMPMVTLEAMACGTPVASLATGPLPEVVEPGITGYLAQTEQDFTEKVEQAGRIDRRIVRGRAEKRFDIRVVAKQYICVYERMLRERGTA
jgi:glycosyltransferase involved in cell wall biosynthesis